MELGIYELVSFTFLGLLPIVNPFSTAPMFLALAKDLSPSDQVRQATKAAIVATIFLTFFLVFGDAVIEFFGITLPSIRISGGIIIFVIGYRMLLAPPDNGAEKEDSSKSVVDFAISPLAVPSLSGPGSISIAIGLGATIPEGREVSGFAAMAVGIALVMFVAWLAMVLSSRIVSYMGRNLIDGITRIMGFILVSMAVQFVINGVQELGI